MKIMEKAEINVPARVAGSEQVHILSSTDRCDRSGSDSGTNKEEKPALSMHYFFFHNKRTKRGSTHVSSNAVLCDYAFCLAPPKSWLLD